MVYLESHNVNFSGPAGMLGIFQKMLPILKNPLTAGSAGNFC